MLVPVFLSAGSLHAGTIVALFELRTAPGVVTTVLEPCQTLPLEVWVTLDGPSPLPNVLGISFFLSLDPHEDGVLSFNDDFVNDSGLTFQITNGTDNEPNSGDFSRGLISFPPGVAFPNGLAKRIGRFSVTAEDFGAAQYAFAHAPPSRVWSLDFADGGTADLIAFPPPVIEVIFNPDFPDEDGDGVSDYCDECPGTPPGMPVDEVGCPIWDFAPADFDRDGDVDMSDFGRLQACLGVVDAAVTHPDCLEADLNGDGDVDDEDVVPFMNCFSGARLFVEAGCELGP